MKRAYFMTVIDGVSCQGHVSDKQTRAPEKTRSNHHAWLERVYWRL